MSSQQDQPATADGSIDDQTEVGEDPEHPHPQDRSSGAKTDDDSPVERYRDSPGMAAFDEEGDVAEPNEPA
jgi:hypothetical protein